MKERDKQKKIRNRPIKTIIIIIIDRLNRKKKLTLTSHHLRRKNFSLSLFLLYIFNFFSVVLNLKMRNLIFFIYLFKKNELL